MSKLNLTPILVSELMRDQLDSITIKDIKVYRKVKKILANFGIGSNEPDFIDLMREGIAAREFGLTWDRIDKLLSERSGNG